MLKSLAIFLTLCGIMFTFKSHFKSEREEQTILISRQKIKEIREKSYSQNGKFEKNFFDSLVEEEVTNEILFREALYLKLNESDPTVRNWLVKNMRFMLKRESGPEKDDDDYFKIQVAANGATTLATVDNDGTSANLTLDADGNMISKNKKACKRLNNNV